MSFLIRLGGMADDDNAPRKEERVEFKIDTDMAKQARDKANSHGWSLSSVLRALVARWLEEDVISPSDVGKAVVSAKDVGKAKKRAPRSGKKKP